MLRFSTYRLESSAEFAHVSLLLWSLCRDPVFRGGQGPTRAISAANQDPCQAPTFASQLPRP